MLGTNTFFRMDARDQHLDLNPPTLSFNNNFLIGSDIYVRRMHSAAAPLPRLRPPPTNLKASEGRGGISTLNCHAAWRASQP